MLDKKNKADKEILQAEYIIPVEGSLELLAMGDKGIRKWREIRKKFEKR